MTARTFLRVQPSAAEHTRRGSALHQAHRPRHLIRVDVQDRRLGVERRTAPFRATVQAWEHDGALKACRDELAAAPHRPEALQHGAMRVRRTLREHVFAEPLAREWLRGERERLRIGGHLAFDV